MDKVVAVTALSPLLRFTSNSVTLNGKYADPGGSAVWCVTYIWGRSLAGIAALNQLQGMDVLLCLLCVL